MLGWTVFPPHTTNPPPPTQEIWGQDFGLCCSILATCSCAPKAPWLGITWPVYSAGSGERGCVQGLINHSHFGRDKQLGPSRGADTLAWPEGTRGDGGTGGARSLPTTLRIIMDRLDMDRFLVTLEKAWMLLKGDLKCFKSGTTLKNKQQKKHFFYKYKYYQEPWLYGRDPTWEPWL